MMSAFSNKNSVPLLRGGGAKFGGPKQKKSDFGHRSYTSWGPTDLPPRCFVVPLSTTKPCSMGSIGSRQGFQKSLKPLNLLTVDLCLDTQRTPRCQANFTQS